MFGGNGDDSCHLRGSAGLSFQVLVLAQPGPGCYGYLESEPQAENSLFYQLLISSVFNRLKLKRDLYEITCDVSVLVGTA